MCDLDLALVSGAGIRTRELAERTFAGTNARHDVTFKNDLGMSRNIQMLGSISFSDLSRHTVLQSAYELIFVLVVIDRRTCHKAYQRRVAQRDSYRQRLIHFFSFSKLDSDIMERQSLDTDTVNVFDLDTVNTDILFIQIIRFSRVACNNSCFRKEEAAVLIVDPVKR